MRVSGQTIWLPGWSIYLKGHIEFPVLIPTTFLCKWLRCHLLLLLLTVAASARWNARWWLWHLKPVGSVPHRQTKISYRFLEGHWSHAPPSYLSPSAQALLPCWNKCMKAGTVIPGFSKCNVRRRAHVAKCRKKLHFPMPLTEVRGEVLLLPSPPSCRGQPLFYGGVHVWYCVSPALYSCQLQLASFGGPAWE